ncbi:hypothetical protein Tco_1061510, partial [Tanacetum coccineum]
FNDKDRVAGLGASAILFINNQTVLEVYNKSDATSSHSGGVACFTQISKLHEKIAELKQISSRPDVCFSSNHTAILFLCLGMSPLMLTDDESQEDLETGHIRSDYRNGGRHDALLSGVPRPYSGESRRGRGRGSYNKGYDGRSRKSKDGEGGYGSFPGAKTQNST